MTSEKRRVFVVHGRDNQARQAVNGFLRALDLHPLDWEEVVKRTGKMMPSLIDALHEAFRDIQAAIILATPDDCASLHPSLHVDREWEHERLPTGQARPNVLFEAGMAMALYPKRTLMIEIGQLRPFSDFGGLNVVRIDGTAAALQKIATRLYDAGCDVNRDGTDWLSTDRFAHLDAFTRRCP
ncbi:TIR domain-containing protein [Cryptosporangium sp. NPDC051539]|uniref:TIR domain-containing protein n=1 Tax=Cryptosporangium sp. NPDC051539 TaxID=3363962 RepID=UPI0037A707F3